MTGKLYLIPTGLGDNAPLEILPISIKKIIENIDIYIVENEKSARKFIKTVSSGKSQSSLTLFSLNKFTDPLEIPSFLEECLEGNNIGLLSDAGCPGVADPGAEVVKIAHKKNIKIIPLVGPSSILLAMMSSGMNGQNFAFNGYLPIKEVEKRKAILLLQDRLIKENQTQIFIETPYRNQALFETFLKYLKPNVSLSISANLMGESEFTISKSIIDWKKENFVIEKIPCVFVIGNY